MSASSIQTVLLANSSVIFILRKKIAFLIFESLKFGHFFQNPVMSLKKKKKKKKEMNDINIVTSYGKIIIRIHFKSSQSHSFTYSLIQHIITCI